MILARVVERSANIQEYTEAIGNAQDLRRHYGGDGGLMRDDEYVAALHRARVGS